MKSLRSITESSAASRPANGRSAPLHGIAKIAAFTALVLALIRWASPPAALAGGICFAFCLGNPFPRHGARLAKRLLQACVILLGFGMDLPAIVRAGWNGSLFAAATIATTLLLGYWIGRRLNLDRNTAALISAGTAICGGSAIAAVGTVLSVTEGEIAVSMGTVFLLNAVALYLFPWIGHCLHLDQQQFGVWAGVAIHDISSVVGASVLYGRNALETATAVKLSRTLWIIPVTLGLTLLLRREERLETAPPDAGAVDETAARKLKVEIPWFMGWFLLASVAHSYVPGVAAWSPQISHLAKWGLTFVLCLIGAGLSPKILGKLGWRAVALGVILWAFISAASLFAILHFPAQV